MMTDSKFSKSLLGKDVRYRSVVEQARTVIVDNAFSDSQPRPYIGAANPYSLGLIGMADSASLTTLPSFGSTTAGSASVDSHSGILSVTAKRQIFLQNAKAFAKHFKLPYEKLFDPKWGSPIYSPYVIALAKGENPSIHTQSAPPGCSRVPDHWGVPIGSRNWNMSTQPVSTVDDPIQACVPDCYLHAAMIALTFSKNFQNTFPSVPGTGTDMTLNLWDETTHAPWTQTISSEVLLDSQGNAVYAQLTPVTATNIGFETWPGLYEKAFAYFKNFPSPSIIKSDRFNPNGDPNITLPSDYRDISYYWTFNGGGGNPLNALVNLTGRQYTANTTFFLTKNQTAADIYLKIKNQCTLSGAHGRTNPPVVAWTYLSDTVAPAPKPIYQNEVLVANHSYAVLGVAMKSPTEKYIVLRNPWGISFGDPNKLLAQDVDLQQATAWFTAMWSVSGFSRAMTDWDGIFALKDSAFKKYFEGYGWVV